MQLMRMNGLSTVNQIKLKKKNIYILLSSWKPIVEYIDEQLEKFYIHESGYGEERRKINDTRVHCCLYFIPPHVRGLVIIQVS